MTGYEQLSEVYEWLMPDAKLTPAGSVAAFADVVRTVPEGGRVLDCSCGTGHLAVGLAETGLDVVATDASPQMVARTRDLATDRGASLRVLHAAWGDLPGRLEQSTFDLVLCVGNSLVHAEGETGRRTALSSMSQLLGPGGRLVLTSRTWELVRSRGSRVDVRDRVVTRDGRDGVVVYSWEIAPGWEDEHRLEIAVAQLDGDGSVRSSSERLSVWPFRYEQLVDDLRDVGLMVETSTFDPAAEEYRVTARAERV